MLFLLTDTFDPFALDDLRGDTADSVLPFDQQGDHGALLRLAKQAVCVHPSHPFCLADRFLRRLRHPGTMAWIVLPFEFRVFENAYP